MRAWNDHGLLFYSPFDKPGLAFAYSQRRTDQQAQRVNMLGRRGFLDVSVANAPDETLTVIDAVHSASGTDDQDLWHVVLMGWCIENEIFASRHTYTRNVLRGPTWRADGNGGISAAIVCANLAGDRRMSQIRTGHLDPIWSRIVDYILAGPTLTPPTALSVPEGVN